MFFIKFLTPKNKYGNIDVYYFLRKIFMTTTATDTGEEDLLILDDDTSDTVVESNDIVADTTITEAQPEASDSLVDFTLEDNQDNQVNNAADSAIAVEGVSDTTDDTNMDLSHLVSEVETKDSEIAIDTQSKEEPALDLSIGLDEPAVTNEVQEVKEEVKPVDINLDTTQTEAFDLDTAIGGFIEQISAIKENNIALINKDEKDIESLE
jgi:hypothetical protein